ncbi:MAG: VOC family protein [Nocardiopsaceae bacterium]|jgi:catechol 2,3-dioxygenase-like lactoylglutathione lyase family enzyme|nr:VOC family protein [Nocardiopsaceae bacterium]
MSRFQLALRVGDLEASVAFYRKLLGVEPAKLRHDYANFAVADPPFKLVLLVGEPDQQTILDHLGIEVDTAAEVDAAADRFEAIGVPNETEAGTECCYALQDKVWVHGPGREPWEVYTVVAEADTLGKSADIAAGHH